MDFLEYLNETFGGNVAFELKEIKYNSMSYDSIKKKIYKLVKDGKVRKACRGMFYIPTEGILGENFPNLERTIRNKYMKDGDEYIGYEFGCNLELGVGVSMQVPQVYEFVTNKEKSALRITKIHGTKVYLKRPYTKITSENYLYLQFLELLRGLPEYEVIQYRNLIKDFYKSKNIDLKKALPYLEYYPSKVTKRYWEVMKDEIIQ